MQTTLKEGVIPKIEEIFGKRVRFNRVERMVYSHDMGILPEQIRKMIKTTPDGVAQPVSVEEIIELVKVAQEEDIPLVPRGAGTSGFGGPVPTKAGIVVDLIRMKNILAIDEDNLTVTVEPGTVWGDLQKYLKDRGYELRLYPSSAKSSTVAGWVAQGGSGYGSYEYGFCGENIASAKVVAPDGIERTFTENDIDLVYGLCGITGIITEVTVKIKEIDDEVAMLAAFDTIEDATKALESFKQKQIPLWSVTFTSPDYISLKQKASQHIVLPEDKYYITIVYPKVRKIKVETPVKVIVAANNGEIMNEHLAKEEWEDKFYPMRFKKLGPTLIASEVIIPIKELANFVSQVEKKFKGAFALEGSMIHDDKIAILGFMLSDERKLGFPLAYASSLSVMELGEKLGGSVFTLGLYFADKAKNLLGQDTLDKVWQYKQKIDAKAIMNPGKVIPGSLDKNSPSKMLLKAMAVANAGKGLISLAGKLAINLQGDNFKSPLNEHITADTFACALCGYCRNVCTVFDANPWESISPRGKYYLLSQYIKGNIELDEEVLNALFACSTCKKCDAVCQIQAQNAHNWLSLRPCFHQAGMENTGLAMIRENVLNTGNFWGANEEDRLKWLDVPTKKEGKLAYWGGCFANVMMDNKAKNFTRILNKLDIDFVHFKEKETCCGLYLALGGYTEDLTAMVKKNLEMFNEAGIETMVFSCPGCYATFSENYPVIAEQLGMECNIKFRHVTYFLSELINSGKIKYENSLDTTVTYHDSCHVGRWFGHYDEPRNVIKSIPGVELKEMESNREDALCCGLVAVFDSRDTVAHAGTKRLEEVEATGADYLITNCGGCGGQFNATNATLQKDVKVKDITDLVAEALGLPSEDAVETSTQYMQGAVELLKDSKIKKVR